MNEKLFPFHPVKEKAVEHIIDTVKIYDTVYLNTNMIARMIKEKDSLIKKYIKIDRKLDSTFKSFKIKEDWSVK